MTENTKKPVAKESHASNSAVFFIPSILVALALGAFGGYLFGGMDNTSSTEVSTEDNTFNEPVFTSFSATAEGDYDSYNEGILAIKTNDVTYDLDVSEFSNDVAVTVSRPATQEEVDQYTAYIEYNNKVNELRQPYYDAGNYDINNNEIEGMPDPVEYPSTDVLYTSEYDYEKNIETRKYYVTEYLQSQLSDLNEGDNVRVNYVKYGNNPNDGLYYDYDPARDQALNDGISDEANKDSDTPKILISSIDVTREIQGEYITKEIEIPVLDDLIYEDPYTDEGYIDETVTPVDDSVIVE